jgi:uncharacterized membrane protein
MNFYSNTKPELVSSKLLHNMEKIFGNYTNNITDNTWQNNMGHFYTNYIQPNLFPIIVIALMAIYLAIRYILKENKTKRKKKKFEEPKKIEKFEKPEKIQEIDKDELVQMYSDSDEYVDTNSNIVQLENEFEQMRLNGDMSEPMMQQTYMEKLGKTSFDDIAKLVM